MDYDDDDFQGHHLYLAAEGSSKFSPVLRPYALSKFDFGDSLQGHVRFDSLVDNEVFLGISGQENNQWIEDFFHGSSVVVFSSGVAESCSITRRNNVWSEATSSESVEMLLNSVGQEEMVPGGTIIKESDLRDELDGLIAWMEPHLKEDDNVKDAFHSQPVSQSNEFLEHIEGTSQTQEGEESIHGSLQYLDPNISRETFGITVTDSHPGVDRICDNACQTEVDTSMNDSLDSKMRINSSGSGMQINAVGPSSQDIAVSGHVIDAQDSKHQVSDSCYETSKCLFRGAGKAGEEHLVSSKNPGVLDQTMEEVTVESGTRNMESFHCSSPNAESADQHEGVEHLVSNEKPDVDDQIMESFICSSSTAESTDQRAVETDICNLGQGVIHTSSDQKIIEISPRENSSVEAENCVHGDDCQLDSNDSVTCGSSNSVVGDLSGVPVARFSPELFVKNLAVEKLGLDGSDVHNEYSKNKALSRMVAESIETYEGIVVSKLNDVHCNQDNSFNEKENPEKQNAEFPCDSSKFDNATDGCLSYDHQRVEFSLHGENMEVKNEVVHGSEHVISGRSEPASDVAFAETNLALLDSVDSIPLLVETGPVADKETDILDSHERTADEGKIEANLLSLKENYEGETDLVPVLQLENGESHSSTRKMVADSPLPTGETNSPGESGQLYVGQQLPWSETSNTTSRSDQPVVVNEISKKSPSNCEDCPILGNSADQEVGGAKGLLVPGNHDKMVAVENYDAFSKVAGGGDAADSIKPSQGTPAAITCSVLSQSEKDEKDRVKGSTSNSLPLSEATVLPIPQKRGGKGVDERRCTVEVHSSAGVSEKETWKAGHSSTTIPACKMPPFVEGSPSTPRVHEMDHKMVVDLSFRGSQAPDGEVARGGSIGTPKRKPRRASGKENSRKRKNGKETTPLSQPERWDKSWSGSVNLPRPGHFVQFEGLKSYANVELTASPCGVVSMPMSNVPDLNTSGPPSVLFQLAFTDSLQMQLRAQIFVYGALIQGAVPDESCMFSAFGASDGGRSVWEPVWRTCIERTQGKKSLPNKSETPVQTSSGDRPSDQSTRQGSQQSKIHSSALGRANHKGTPSSVVNSMIPLSSPLWNIPTSDYRQTFSPLHPFKPPPARSFVGHSTPWISQSNFPSPWVASPSPQTSGFDASARFSQMETIKMTPIKESSAPVSSGRKHATPCTLAHTVKLASGKQPSTPVPSEIKHAAPSTMVHTSGLGVFAGIPSLADHKFSDPKARKKKKVTISEGLGQISLLGQTRTEPVSVLVGTSHLSTSVIVSTPACFGSKAGIIKIGKDVSPTSSSTAHLKTGEQDGMRKAIISEETLINVEEVKLQAEDASSSAAVAVSQSQSLWSQLNNRKNSGVIPDVEAKLACSAMAIVGAASVAKAAAAAAKIASNAALQAKLVADEALKSSTTRHPVESDAVSHPVVNNLGSSCSSSIIIAAREAARKRVEAASAASKHAENLDAIVKAAELAAEAVSLAGKIVAMSDPSPFNELVEVGPENYCRVSPQVSSEQGVVSDKYKVEQSKLDRIEGQPEKEMVSMDHSLSRLPGGEVLSESAVDNLSSFALSEKETKRKRSHRGSELAKPMGVIPESEIGSTYASITCQEECEKGAGTSMQESIKEGSLVEVLKDGCQKAWFSANVLSLKDGKAFVCYTNLQSDEGEEKLKEWVDLKAEVSSAPKIRIAHPVTTMLPEGTRKRCRAARGDFGWSIGDRVDAWCQHFWREGVVTEKGKKNDSTFTVQFPVDGETSVFKTWQLRPTLIWRDGKWIQWFSPAREKNPPSQGDTPQKKRLKLGIPAAEGKQKDRTSKSVEFSEPEKLDVSRLLPLSGNEKIFTIGKHAEKEDKPNLLKAISTGLHKERSRVIFGVPKPGKKRKFMEVSKHYLPGWKSKTDECNDSVKLAKYLIPQGSGSRGWKTGIRNDPKAKQASVSKTRVPRGKAQSVSSRTLPQKNKILTSASPALNDGSSLEVGRQSPIKSDKTGALENPFLFSSVVPPSEAPLKIFSSKAKSEQVNRGRLLPSSGKLSKVGMRGKPNIDNPEQLIPEAVEPRRSNRRIQPTSRLLEGLQSSLIISKIPSFSLDSSPRNQQKATSKGNNHV